MSLYVLLTKQFLGNEQRIYSFEINYSPSTKNTVSQTKTNSLDRNYVPPTGMTISGKNGAD